MEGAHIRAGRVDVTASPHRTRVTAFDVRATFAVRSVVALLDRALPRLPDDRPPVLGRLPGAGVHLTYDDGPSPATTQALLDALGTTRATFFLLGDAVRRHPTLARAIADAGHAVGLHGPTHADPWRQRLQAPAWNDARSVLEDATGSPVVAMRPPFGHLTPGLLRWARRHTLPVWLWDVMPGDFRPNATPQRIAADTTRLGRPGSLVVLHEGPAVAAVSLGATRHLLGLGQ